MNKYTLYFKDKEVEEKYQNIAQRKFRMFTLNIITMGLLIVCTVKLIEESVAGVLRNILMYIVVIGYLLFQYWLTRRYQRMVRISLLLLNHLITLFFNLQIQDSEDYYYSYLRGANVMGANFLFFFSGEFIDALISAFSTAIIRAAIILLKSEKIEFSTILATVLVAFLATRFFYHFHKANRSQYLLTLNDSHWEKVLNSIAFKQPYLLFSFVEENLNFQLKQEGQFQQFLNNQLDGLSFLKDAKYKGNKLENFIYQQIKKFRVDRASVFNRTLIVEHLKKLLRVECSIFYGNKPSVLIMLRDYLKEKKPDMTLYEKRHRNFTKLLLKVLGNYERHKQPNPQLKYLQRKLLQIQLLEDIKSGKLQSAQVSMFVLAHFLNSLYPQLSVRAVIDGDVNLLTIPNILLLIMLFVAENATSSSLFLCLNESFKKTRSLTIKGQFDVEKLKLETAWLQDYLRLIIQIQKIEECSIYFQFNSQILIPFWLSEMAIRSSKRVEV